MNPHDRAREAAIALQERTGDVEHSAAVVLGSGWASAADMLGETVSVAPLAELPHFAAPTVAGHDGRARTVRFGSSHALVFEGRTHLYENHDPDQVVHAVRTAAAAGARTVILTNAAGGLDPSWRPGTPVLISDHINLTGVSPLSGPVFVDLTDLYSPRLRALARELDPDLAEGVYVQFRGPQYETPAEIAMVRAIGGSLVGMSTALEAIAAREAGMDVLAVSLVTNLAAGVADQPLDHLDVLAAGRRSAARMGALLAKLLPIIERDS